MSHPFDEQTWHRVTEHVLDSCSYKPPPKGAKQCSPLRESPHCTLS